MKKHPGGSWPEKTDKMIAQCAKELGLPIPEYVQHTGGDMAFLQLCLKTGRYPGVTYNGRDDFYRGPIGHMVNLVHLSAKYAVIQDNNRPGTYLWMTPAEFESRWKGSGGGWAIVLLTPGKPPELGKADYAFFEAGPPATDEIDCSDLEWRPAGMDKPGMYYLFRGDKHIGTYHPDARGFAWLKDGNWVVDRLPLALPVANYGINAKHVNQSLSYSYRGRPCGEDVAKALLIDDSSMKRVVVVADKATRDKIVAAWKSDKFSKHRDKYLLQVFDPSDWQVKGYPAGVTIVSFPDGAVVKSGVEFLDPNQLAALLDWIANPTPDTGPLEPIVGPLLDYCPKWLCYVLVALLGLLIRHIPILKGTSMLAKFLAGIFAALLARITPVDPSKPVDPAPVPAPTSSPLLDLLKQVAPMLLPLLLSVFAEMMKPVAPTEQPKV